MNTPIQKARRCRRIISHHHCSTLSQADLARITSGLRLRILRHNDQCAFRVGFRHGDDDNGIAEFPQRDAVDEKLLDLLEGFALSLGDAEVCEDEDAH